jgi:hypothetical protein
MAMSWSKAFLLAGLLGFVAWYGLVGGRRLAPEHVHQLYEHFWLAFIEGDQAALCDLLDERFKAHIRKPSRVDPLDLHFDRAESCALIAQVDELKHKMEEQSGETLYVNVEHTVRSVELSADRRQATAVVDTELRIGTEAKLYFKVTETQTDHLVRRWGRTKVMDSEGVWTFYR